MMRAITLLILVIAYPLAAQTGDGKWAISTGFSYGSENNWGNPGLMILNEYEYRFSRSLSVGARIGLFHSLPLFIPDGFYFQYSSLSLGTYLNHTTNFNRNRNFVRLSAGPSYFHYNYLAAGSQAEYDAASRFGYGLGLEGGGNLSEKVSMGLMLNIYSYHIFGDIIVVGINGHFRL